MKAKGWLWAATAVALLAVVPTAGAASDVRAVGLANKGTLVVQSFAVLAPRAVTMTGGWFDDGKPCETWRALRVFAEIAYDAPDGTSRRVRRSKASVRRNCPQSPPSLGFRIRAGRHGLACPDGTWRPGRYSFTTRTRHVATGLQAVATLVWEKEGEC